MKLLFLTYISIFMTLFNIIKQAIAEVCHKVNVLQLLLNCQLKQTVVYEIPLSLVVLMKEINMCLLSEYP